MAVRTDQVKHNPKNYSCKVLAPPALFKVDMEIISASTLKKAGGQQALCNKMLIGAMAVLGKLAS